jgi:uncharacterized protein (DUF924 family)
MEYKKVLDFWFKLSMKQWYSRDLKLDHEIKQKFLTLWKEAK